MADLLDLLGNEFRVRHVLLQGLNGLLGDVVLVVVLEPVHEVHGRQQLLALVPRGLRPCADTTRTYTHAHTRYDGTETYA
jgi:hypothetical protein